MVPGDIYASNVATSNKLKQKAKAKCTNEEPSTTDERNIHLHARLEKGKGCYTKGLFNKKKMLNLKYL